MTDEREDVASEAPDDAALEVDATPEEAVEDAEATPSAGDGQETEVQRLTRELDEMRSREAERSRADETRRADPPTTDPARASELAQTNRKRMDEYNELQREAMLLEGRLGELAKTDDVAAYALNQSRQQAIVARANLEASNLALHEAQLAQDEVFIERTFSDPAKRSAFKAWLTPEQKMNFRSVEVARKAWLGEQYEAQQAALTKQQAAAAKVVAAKDKGVVATGTREVTATEAVLKRGGKLSGAAFDAHFDKLTRDGRWDEAAAFSARAGELVKD